MTKNEIISCFKDYIKNRDDLSAALKKKKKTQSELKYYEKEREEPKPEYPSVGKCILRSFIPFYALKHPLVIAIAVLLVIIAEKLPSRIYLFSVIAILGGAWFIMIRQDFRKEKKELCAKFVEEGLVYNEWRDNRDKKIPVLRESVRVLTDQISSLQYKLQNHELHTMVHDDYIPCANTLLSYFVHGRVSTMQEAINLLISEQREQRRDEDVQRHYKQMEYEAREQTAAAYETAHNSRTAAEAAQDAAFWGAASAYSASSAAAELKDINRRL